MFTRLFTCLFTCLHVCLHVYTFVYMFTRLFTCLHVYMLLVYMFTRYLFLGWNELLIAGFSHRSTAVKDGILLATGLHVHRSSAHQAGVGTIFDRVLTELVAKMREMKMDKTELGSLRAIVLFNPGQSKLYTTL